MTGNLSAYNQQMVRGYMLCHRAISSVYDGKSKYLQAPSTVLVSGDQDVPDGNVDRICLTVLELIQSLCVFVFFAGKACAIPDIGRGWRTPIRGSVRERALEQRSE